MLNHQTISSYRDLCYIQGNIDENLFTVHDLLKDNYTLLLCDNCLKNCLHGAKNQHKEWN